MAYLDEVLKAVKYLKEKEIKPEIGIILGSGLGDLVNVAKDKIVIPILIFLDFLFLQ